MATLVAYGLRLESPRRFSSRRDKARSPLPARLLSHDLSFVSIALDSAVTLPEASSLARHASTRVTAQVYAGLADGGQHKAAAKLVAAGFGR